LLATAIFLLFTWPLEPTAALAAESNSLVLISNGEPVGTLDAEQKDGSVQVRYRVDNNGRGPKVDEALQLDQDGYPLSWTIEGTSLFGATIDEAWSVQDGVASWHGQADHGSAEVEAPLMYIGGDASPWALGMYARALLATPGRQLDVLPSGRMRLETLETMAVGETGETVGLYELSGIQLEPQLIALDSEGGLFASFGGSGGLIRKGYENALPRLNDWARDHEFRRLKRMQSELAHRYDAPIRYRDVRVFDSAGQRISEPVSVLVRDGKIAAIDPAGTAGDPTAEGQVDGENGVLVPGLCDMHSHSSLGSGLYYLAAGVTCTRDMGNDNQLFPQIQQAIEAGELAGPRITPDGLIEARSPYSARLGIVADTLDEALEAVRWYAAHGYFEIKIYNSMKPEWVPALAAEAHKLGLGLTGHVPAFMTPDAAIEAGYNSIAHINQLMLGWLLEAGEDTRTALRLTAMKRAAHLDLNEPAVQKTVTLMKEHSTALDTTAVILERLMLSRAGEVPPGDHAYLSHMPIGYQRYRKRSFVPLNEPGDDAEYQAAFETLLKVIKLLRDNGIKLLPGTDDTTGFTVQRELELYVKAGVPAAETLAMATLGAASYLRKQDEMGSIEPGKYADFFLVSGDPVRNISDVRKVRLVSRGGTIYFPDEIYPALGIAPFAAAAKVASPGAQQ